MAERTLVLGIGNPARGDDGIGHAVVHAIRALAPSSVDIEEAGGEATTVLEHIEGRERVIIVDACVAGTQVGAIHRFDVVRTPLPTAPFAISSHGLGLHQALELARALDSLPRQCIVYAIEGATFAAGDPLSPSLKTAVATLARMLAGQAAVLVPGGG